MNARTKALAEGAARRSAFLESLIRTADVERSLAEIGVTISALRKWCVRWPDFAAAYRTLVADLGASGPKVLAPVTAHNANATKLGDWGSGFADFRSHFLKTHTPWFHDRTVNAVEHASPGSITLIIMPPEHGKTRLLEDADTYWICNDPSQRIGVASERQAHAAKIVAFVRRRLENDAPGMGHLRATFGPFAPMKGRARQTWAADHFDVFKKPRGGTDDERDFTMSALGITGSVVGTRLNKLQVDDMQSRKTLRRTKDLMDVFRDDWLTRPGSHGVTFVLMNVVGEGDVSEAMIDEGLVDDYIMFAAFDESYLELGPRAQADGTEPKPSPWLWCERYSEADYLRMKRNAGQDGWDRKYMQVWRPERTRTFTKALIDAAKNPVRSFRAPATPLLGEPAHVEIGLDPGFKRTALVVAAFEPLRLRYLDHRVGVKLTATSQIVDLLSDLLALHHDPPRAVVDAVVIESKAFQKGLLTDERILELRSHYGFSIVAQETGWDKSDIDYGVAQVAQSLERGEIDFPDVNALPMEELYDEMLRWRPGVRGAVLQQDILMAFWFVWARWRRRRRRAVNSAPANWTSGRVPGAPRPRVTGPAPSNWNVGALASRRTGR